MTTAQSLPYAALESQLAQIEFWRSPRAATYAAHLDSSLTADDMKFSGSVARNDEWREILLAPMADRLLQATPYFVSLEVIDLIQQGMDNFPGDIPWGSFWPESKIGWAFFERPLSVPTGGVGAAIPWRAILWFQTPTDPTELSALVCTNANIPGFPPGLMPIRLAHRVFNHSDLDDLGDDIEGVPPMLFTTRFMAGFFSFLRQKLVSLQGQRAPRPARKRFWRITQTEAPLVRVIQLRRREVRGKENGHGEPRDWSHRWIVSGHWRKQWYSSRHRHEPLFIDSYVKGPDDKPLKARRVNLYAVVN